MIPWVKLGEGPVPGTPETMRLMQRGAEFSILVGKAELMNSRVGGSEAALATLALARLARPARARVLIGGLGMGYTLRAALDALGPEGRVVVSELVPIVGDWARGPLAHLFAGSLDDPRVELRVEDVNRSIQAEAAGYDAVLLDVDNGPSGLTRRENDRLYDGWGLKRARRALRPGGVLGVWSGAPDRKFKARLRNSGFEVEEARVRAKGTTGLRNVVWLATAAG